VTGVVARAHTRQRKGVARAAALLDGVSWNGVGLVLLLCFVNGVRRHVPSISEQDVVVWPWLLDIVQTTGWTTIVAIPIALAVVAAYNLAPPRATARYAAVVLGAATASLLALPVSMTAEAFLGCGGDVHACFGDDPLRIYIGNFTRYFAMSALFALVFVHLRDADESATRAREAEEARARFVERMEEARLAVLQAQIEPHFLFNTLANVRRLYQTAPSDAATMLENLMRYFAAALPQMRASESTLGREAELTAAYLRIQQIRMGRRLAFDIAIPPALRDVALPPMVLLTLAENAVKHGLAPLREGGRVEITAAVDERELRVRVIDSGGGFRQSSGGGTGLANIRARLSGLYGSAGRLTLSSNTPHGVTATIAVPLSAEAAS
jgi:signal transduction histidine kinase